MRRRTRGRPRNPVTTAECDAWFLTEINELRQRYVALLDGVRRSQVAYAIATDIARAYARLPHGSPLRPELIDAAFLEHGVKVPPELVPMVSSVECADAGSVLRIAVRVVTRITRVSGYSMMAQRRAAQPQSSLTG